MSSSKRQKGNSKGGCFVRKVRKGEKRTQIEKKRGGWYSPNLHFDERERRGRAWIYYGSSQDILGQEWDGLASFKRVRY